MDDLHAATEALRDGVARRAVRVSLISALANNWLMPRLADYTRRHPGIEIDLQTSPDLVDIEAGAVDLAIRLGEGDWPNLRAEMLLPIDIFPVCSPELAAGIRSPSDLCGQVLIGPGHRPEFWPEYLNATGLDPNTMPSVRPIDGFLLYEAAANGMGVAIGLDPLVRPFLASGRLARPLDLAVRSKRSFHLVRAQGAQPRSVHTFEQWLSAQARADAAIASGAVR